MNKIEKLEITINNQTVICNIDYNKRKNVYIKVINNNEILLKAPFEFEKNNIKKIVHNKKEWIFSKFNKFSEYNYLIKEKEYKNNDLFLYLGKQYSLFIKNNNLKKSYIFINNENLVVETNIINDKEYIKNLIKSWYIKNFKLYLFNRLELYSKKLNVFYNKVYIKNQQTKWGSCSQKNNLNFNWNLIKAPEKVLDYVIIHELCHIKHKNHGSLFWEELYSIFPDYKLHKNWLKEYGFVLKY